MSKTVLVTRDFDKSELPIGELIPRDDVEVPYGSVFALGGEVLEMEKDKDGNTIITKFGLLEISLIPDTNYIEYLKRETKAIEQQRARKRRASEGGLRS